MSPTKPNNKPNTINSELTLGKYKTAPQIAIAIKPKLATILVSNP